ncbi:5'-methylthioadenosine/S-adenosylhomocysteine nucleosidase [Ammoniphilus oxalaticus]|uniref:adenosylhomocysteine nucleosidase n=1 Tax=Ammoniphilus oxalaticus TaxID=66863 RepID=A0A419SR73_9BACL|nr:5'-methylthioadenosine/adenosylhomocysteine nucleosidase [Ammoniphilus oxalaticus]RKD27020.1 5'-methylthioadenosine/S-adenosylhomocysteine nucleosidase [Ammoniphilus oxalaticus]
MIGIIGAMDEEIHLFKKGMEHTEEKVKAGITYYVGEFQGKPIALCKSGVGKVNASVCSQILIDRFGVSGVIFTGVAGALDPTLEIGDIVISEDCQYHDLDASALGFEKGEIPFAQKSVFAADSKLIEIAMEASQEITEGKTMTGRIISGDQFVADRTTVTELHHQFNAACVEMEGAAIAHVCDMNDVPFVIVRSMSDKADGSADVNFLEFTKLASNRSYEIVARMLKKM